MLFAKLKLAYSNSFNRANSSAGIATHALILTDYGFTVLDGINGTGAGSSTCTTSDAFISVNRNHIHLRTSPFQIKLDCSQKIMKSQQPNTFEMNVLKHIPIIPYLRQFCKRISANFDKYIISFSSLDASLINLLFINESIRCAGVRLCRRRCAATRARSSATRKGLDKKSSAPMPSPSSTAASSVRALRNRMGTSVRLRMRRQTAKPSSPGIITSSRMQSAQRHSGSVNAPPACRVSTR